MQPPVIEVVAFTLRPGTDPAHLQDGIAASWRFVHAQPGFLGRHLARTEDGAMIDIVIWRDAGSAQAAAAAFPAAPGVGPFVGAIATEGFSMRHYAALPPPG